MNAAFIATLALMAPPQDANFDSPDWRVKMAAGYLPYHRVLVEDFKVVDQAPTEDDIYTTGFVEFVYDTVVVSRRPYVVGISRTRVWSGLDKNRSWRRTTLANPAKFLDHEQGHLDINELHAYRLAKVTQFPKGSGADYRSAHADLVGKMNRFFREYDSLNQQEQDLYDRETRSGLDPVKQQAWRAALDVRLKAAGLTALWRADKVYTTYRP